MTDDDMNEVVTRGILKEELKKELKKVLEKELDPIRARLDEMATKRDLETWAGAIMAQIRAEVRADFQSALGVAIGQLERNLGLALEPTKDLSERVAALEGADLPGRVTRLETRVFPPSRTTRRRRG